MENPFAIIPEKNRREISKYLFQEGVCFANKDYNLPKHPEINVPNLQVIKKTSERSRDSATDGAIEICPAGVRVRNDMDKGKKRQREEGEEEEGEIQAGAGSSNADDFLSLEENLTFSDTLMALRIIRAQFPRIDKVSIQPFILQSQLYSSVKDRTQVDRELESLRRERVLRIFKLNTGQDDHGIMFLDDYLKQVECVMKRMEEKEQGYREVLSWFTIHVIVSKLEPSIQHEELCSLLSLGGKVKDGHVSLLINAGLLTRQLIDQNMYWLAIPNIGSVLKSISQGRKELLSFLNRRRYKEMSLSTLEKKRLRFSLLDMRFHLRDLIGSGHIRTIQTPSGIVVRVSKD